MDWRRNDAGDRPRRQANFFCEKALTLANCTEDESCAGPRDLQDLSRRFRGGCSIVDTWSRRYDEPEQSTSPRES